MNKISYRRVIAILSFGILFLLTPIFTLNAMTVSPVRLELSGDAGSTIGASFKVFNDEKEAKTLYTSFENFEASGETGSPSFKPSQEGLASWITAPETIEIPVGESKTVDFQINIPPSTEPGGYFAAIFVGSTPPDSNANELAIGSRLGSLVLFRVNGDIDENGSLLEFASQDKKKWHNALPVNFYYRFQNSGDDRVFPKSSLTIKNTFGRDRAVIDANPTEGNVLPGSIRRFEVWWKSDSDTNVIPKLQPSDLSFIDTIKYQWHNFAVGRYTANLNINYGAKGEVATSSFALFVFPWQLMLVEVLIVVIGLSLIRFIFGRYNRYIIKRARS